MRVECVRVCASQKWLEAILFCYSQRPLKETKNKEVANVLSKPENNINKKKTRSRKL